MDIDKETIKAFCGIDKAIDESFLKLSDKLSDLTLSHNRKKKALEEIEDLIQQPEFKMETHDIIHDCPKVLYFFPVDKIDLILKKIDNALWSDGRERRVSVKKNKVFSYSKAWKKYKDLHPFNTWFKDQTKGGK